MNKQVSIPNQSSIKKTILLTGCTGFVGSYLLSGLLKSEFHIICLIRASSDSNARLRLMTQMTKNGLITSADNLDSIDVFAADLSQDYLGLGENLWLSLSNRVDEVFHLAATVNMTASFEELYADNIKASAQILRFCLAHKKKKLYYASTLSVLISATQGRELNYEEGSLSQLAEVHGGYTQTKWAAEYLVSQYQAQIPIGIFRLGLITGNSLNGHAVESDLLMSFLQSILLSQSSPVLERDKDYFLNPTPVDYAIEAMIYIAQKEQTGFFHIINESNFSLSMINNILLNDLPSIKMLPIDQWREQLYPNLKNNKMYLAAYMSVCNSIKYNPLDLFQVSNIDIRQINTRKVLLGSKIVCPPANSSLLMTYLTYCQAQLKLKTYLQTDINPVNENS